MNDIAILAPLKASIEQVAEVRTLPVFDQNTVDFVRALSDMLLRGKSENSSPELVALGFWLRESNIVKIQSTLSKGCYQGLGTVVHYAPANVDTMFIYSWTCSLLMGNKNIVRVSSKESDTQNALLKSINELFSNSEFEPIAQRNVFVRFERDAGVGSTIASLADARVIWGGDESVNNIRSIPCKPRCRDISFADRYSACLINGDSLQSDEQVKALALKLWRDIQPYEQQACSSPRVIFWQGNKDLQDALFNEVGILARNSNPAISQANEHLFTTQLIKSQEPSIENKKFGPLSLLMLKSFKEPLLDWHAGLSMLYQVQIRSLDEIGLLVSSKLQTLSHWGFKEAELLNFAESESISGISRIVPVGQALDFSSVWDGYDLLQQLSNQKVIKY